MPSANKMQQQSNALLITGAAGFLGQQAVTKALAEGNHVVAVVRPRGEDGRSESPTLANLMRTYPHQLEIEKVNLEDEASVHALMERHPEVDHVLHAAAMIAVPTTSEGLGAAQRANVDATRYLAQACEEQAAKSGRVMQFHFVSSINALQLEKGVQFLPSINSLSYATTKCVAREWLHDNHASALAHLDISISYPPNVIGPTQSSGISSKLLEVAQEEEDGKPHDMQREYKDRNLQGNSTTYIKMVHSENYLRDVFSCFTQAATPGFQEYSITPDYHLKLGELVRIIGQVIDTKRPGAPKAEPDVWPDMGEQMEMDFQPRALPSPPSAPPHQNVDLRNVLAAQYDHIAQSKQRAA